MPKYIVKPIWQTVLNYTISLHFDMSKLSWRSACWINQSASNAATRRRNSVPIVPISDRWLEFSGNQQLKRVPLSAASMLSPSIHSAVQIPSSGHLWFEHRAHAWRSPRMKMPSWYPSKASKAPNHWTSCLLDWTIHLPAITTLSQVV